MNVDEDVLDDIFESLLGQPFPGESNFNTAPTEPVWIVRSRRQSDGGGLEAAEAQWWLTPYWSRTAKPRYATFNAKAETLATSRTFAEPFRRRRCVVPVAGFYEWRRDGTLRQPFYVRPESQPSSLCLGGVWDRWRPRDGSPPIESFAVVTTAVSPGLEFLHDRQPLMLSPHEAARWLDHETPSEELARLLEPRLPHDLAALPVSNYVGDPRHKGRQCSAAMGMAIAIGANS